MKAEEEAHLAGKKDEKDKIRRKREQVFKAVKMQETDQFIIMFPQMFTSLIASSLNEMLASIYWIISNKEGWVAKSLFKHFLQETRPIFDTTSGSKPGRSGKISPLLKRKSDYAEALLARVSPRIHDLYEKLLKGTALPYRIHLSEGPLKGQVRREMPLRSKWTRSATAACLLRTISYRSVSITSSMLFIFSHKHLNLPHHSVLLNELNFSVVPPALAYLLLDAMRTVYGEDFSKDAKSMQQVAFASTLDWDYRAPERSGMADCDENHHEDIMTDSN